MKPYRRFVAYVYAYDNNKKGENRGFVKVESKMGRCYMSFQVKGLPREQQEYEILGFYYTDDVMEGIPLGKAEAADGVLVAELETDSEDLMGSGVSLEQLGGILLVGGADVRLGTEWEDRPITFDAFRLRRETAPSMPENGSGGDPADQPEAAPQARRESEAENRESETENQPGAGTGERRESGAGNQPGAATGENRESGTENRPVVEAGERQEPRMENQPGAEIGEPQRLEAENRLGAEPVEHQRLETENRPGAEPVAHQEPREENRPEAETREPQDMETENPLPTEPELVVEENLDADSEREKADNAAQDDLVDLQLQEELYRTEYIQETTSDRDKNVQQQDTRVMRPGQPEDTRREQQSTRPGQPEDARREQQGLRPGQPENTRREQQNTRPGQQENLRREQQGSRQGQQNKQGDQQERRTDVHMQRNRTCPAELALQRDWENMRKEYPHLEEMKDGEWEDAIKINPQDVRRLRQRNWTVGNNNFLLHAYNSYHYLVLAKIAGRNQYVLAVPGVFDHQERFMASMFGFPNFKSAQPGKMQMGQFGYWYRPIC